MKCFLSYSSTTNISVVKKILKDKNIGFDIDFEQVDSTLISSSVSIHQLKSCDFVVAVIDGGASVFFEVGMAIGLKKPTFLIIPSNSVSLIPHSLGELLYTLAEPTDYEKIKYSFDFFVKKLPKKSRNKSRIQTPKRRQKKTKLKNQESQVSISSVSTGIEFENIVFNLLSGLKLDMITVNPLKGREFQADFSIWVDELDSIFGNPIIIETKSRFERNEIVQSIQQLLDYLQKYNSRTALLIYQGNSDETIKAVYQNNRIVLIMSYQELASQLRSRSFVEVLANLRNEMVHKEE